MWNDPAAQWEAFDLVAIRSTWDYWKHRREFLQWVHRCAGLTRLWNPEPTVIWNSHKSYLLELARRGVSVVPTELGRPGESLADLCLRRGWGPVVVKPMVGAAADGAHFVPEAERAAFERSYAAAVERVEQIVQPFIEGVLDPGERSLVYFDGEFSHAFAKGPALPVDLREARGMVPVQVSSDERALADTALASAGSVPLYARVDIVPGPSDRPLLMELELVEPYLHLADSVGAQRRFVAAVEARLSGTRATGTGGSGR